MSNVSHDSSPGMGKLAAAVREAQEPALRLADPHERQRARARLLQAVDREARDARPVHTAARANAWRWGFAGMAAAACALALIVLMPDAKLEFEVDGVEAQAQQLIVAGQYTRELDFSDSTAIALEPGGRMMIAELRSNGASVVLEQGEISLAVHHEHDTSWQVAAGPYEVHVTGTEFSVEWEPSSGHFEVEVEEGSVRVEGPEGELAKLRAGESYVPARGKATIEPETLDIASPEDTGHNVVATRDDLAQTQGENGVELPEGETEAELEGETEAIAGQINKPSQARGPSWTSFFEDADYPGAWAALADHPGGIQAEAKHADAETLLDLADVARFTKHRDDARKLLELLRHRFPGSDEAGEAAFTLGRLAADGGSQAQAASYFELYLTERPAGSLAGDALGRLMDSYRALGRSDDERSAAERYLARFPKGPHAGKAQAILGG